MISSQRKTKLSGLTSARKTSDDLRSCRLRILEKATLWTMRRRRKRRSRARRGLLRLPIMMRMRRRMMTIQRILVIFITFLSRTRCIRDTMLLRGKGRRSRRRRRKMTLIMMVS